MGWIDDWGVSLATFLPAAGAIVLLFLPGVSDRIVKIVGTAFAFLALVAGILILFRFDFGNAGQMQLDVDVSWIPTIDSRYHIGVDGISLPLLELSVLVTFLCAIYLWFHVPEPGKIKAFFILMLLLET